VQSEAKKEDADEAIAKYDGMLSFSLSVCMCVNIVNIYIRSKD